MLYKIATTLRKGLLPKLSGTATDVLKGNGTWGASSLTIGATISSGTAARVLYEDSSHLLAESSRLTFDDLNDILTVGVGNASGAFKCRGFLFIESGGSGNTVFATAGSSSQSDNRLLSFDINDGDRTVNINGNLTLKVWTTWTPSRTGWTDVGSPTVTGRYCQVGPVIHFQIKVVPGTTVATTAGTSYTTLPVSCGASALSGMAMMQNLSTLIAVGDCVIDTANSRCYVPTQAASGNTLLIAGNYEV